MLGTISLRFHPPS